MSMETNLQGRLRNTFLPNNNGLLPLFEAVVNSIHAIEEAEFSPENGKIIVKIIRDTQEQFNFENETKKRGPEACKDILGFQVIDNGIGFTDINMKSFLTLDSDHKVSKGGRGVGRLLWLKAFKKVHVSSSYLDADAKLKLRTFNFTASHGVTGEKNEDQPLGNDRSTIIHLDKFEDKYRKASYKTTQTIADSLFEHCLWYFVREGGVPKIIIQDEEGQVNLDEIYEAHMVSSADTERLELKNKQFDLTHIKLRENSSRAHVIAFCAANRLVKEENITGKIPGLYGEIEDRSGEFVYACYVTSSFLDETVRSERTSFDISDNPGDLFLPTELTFNEIRESVLGRVTAYLSKYLEENKAKAREHVEAYISRKAPKYRPILSRIPEEKLIIDPSLSDKDLDLILHRHYFEIEEQLLADGHEIMNQKVGEEVSDYQARLQNYLKTAEEIKKSDLASYVSHRRVVLDLLEKALQRNLDGKYTYEELIHELIIPLRKDSNELNFEWLNLWLLDERLAFHDYLASDKSIASLPITDSEDKKEPDICSLYVTDNPILVSEENNPPFSSLTVIEIKRPMRNDIASGEEKDPIEQCLGYVQRIRDGKVTTKNGRPLGNPQDIPAYCYVVCDLTSTMVDRCKMHDFTITNDGLGYFGYKQSYKAFVEVISFDKLVNSAKQRNKAFFDKLGLPTT